MICKNPGGLYPPLISLREGGNGLPPRPEPPMIQIVKPYNRTFSVYNVLLLF